MLAQKPQGRSQRVRHGVDVALAARSSIFSQIDPARFCACRLAAYHRTHQHALSIDRLADQSRKAVYQAAQIAHSSRALADEIATMERAVRQTHILGDTSLLENYFSAHDKFESMAASLFELSLHANRSNC